MELSKNPEEITARESGLYAESGPKCAKAHGQKRAAKGSSVDPVLVSTKNVGELSDIQVLRAAERVQAGNSVRAVAKSLGVSHTALNKRLKKFSEENGYCPDELDKAIIRAALATGLPGVLGRLSDILGWTRIEILEAVK